MPLTPDVVAAHVAEWTKRLAAGNFPYRQHWPSRLFRHEPVENIVKILRTRTLLSRNASKGMRVRDIADPEVVATQGAAHDLVRLYFRPRNPTQFHIEGIRKPTEYFNGVATNHAPVLVFVLFKAEAILGLPGVQFSDGNMQHGTTRVFQTAEQFSALPFANIYSAGGTGGDREVVRNRCAEVLCPNPLALTADNIEAVMCRSSAERATLLHMLGDQGQTWANRVRVATGQSLYDGRFVYVESVNLNALQITAMVHQRVDNQPFNIRLRVMTLAGGIIADGSATGSDKSWWMGFNQLAPGSYLCEVYLEGFLAYQATGIVEDLPF